MGNLKNRFKNLIRVGLTSITLLDGIRGDGHTSRETSGFEPNTPGIQMVVSGVENQLDSEMSQEDRDRYVTLLDVMAQTPHGAQLLGVLKQEETQLGVVDKFEDDNDNSETWGESWRTKSIMLKRDHLHSPAGLWTLAHEAEHVKQAANFSKMAQTLDDAHTLTVLREALSERAGFLVVREAMECVPGFISPEDYRTILKKRYDFLDKQGQAVKEIEANAVFDARMKNDTSVRRNYEDRSSGNMVDSKHFGDNPVWNQVMRKVSGHVLGVNPDWDRVVRKMSGGEVQSVSKLPAPSWMFIEEMITQSYRSGNREVDKVDLSCVEQHKTDLLQGDAFKESVVVQIASLFNSLGMGGTVGYEMLKDMFPPDIKEKGSADANWDDFYAHQTNQEYLTKAIKILKNPALDKMADQQDAKDLEFWTERCKDKPGLFSLIYSDDSNLCRSKLAETRFILNTYRHVFFGKENQRTAGRTNPAENIHL